MKKLKNWQIYLLLFIYTLFMGLLCVGSSPLLDYMDPDSQNFRLMGRAVVAGQVAFRDIFDHKGLYIYFIDALGALISPNSSLGIFILEIVCYFINTLIVYKIALIFTKKELPSFLSAAGFLAYSFNYFTFITGNLTEDWSMFLQMIAVWIIVKYYFVDKTIEHKPIYMFIHGLVATIAGFMRPNNAGMWIAFGIVLAARLFANGKIKNFFINLGTLVLGVLTGSLPVVIYAIKYDLFEDIIYGTFGANITYTNNNNGFHRLLGFLKDFVTNPAVMVFISGVIGCVIVIKYFMKNKNNWFVWTFISMFVTSLVFMNVSMRNNGQYQHLYIIFSIPVFIGFFAFLENFRNTKLQKLNPAVYVSVFMIVIISCGIVANIGLIRQTLKFGSYHQLFEAAVDMDELIEDKNTKVLVTGCNSVMYNETHTLSHIKYFITYGGGLDYSVFPDATYQQRDSILSLENEYVIIHFDEENHPYGIADVDEQIMDCLSASYEEIYLKNEGEIIALYKRL